MGRSPLTYGYSCDDDEVMVIKKGPWTSEEDQKLIDYITKNGHGSWRSLPKLAGLNRCGKSCRLRWTNYLRPDIKRGHFTQQEQNLIINLHALLGNKWSSIAGHLPGRTDNEIKNMWNTQLKKKLMKMGIDPVTHKPIIHHNHLNISNLLLLPQLVSALSSNHNHNYNYNLMQQLLLAASTVQPNIAQYNNISDQYFSADMTSILHQHQHLDHCAPIIRRRDSVSDRMMTDPTTNNNSIPIPIPTNSYDRSLPHQTTSLSDSRRIVNPDDTAISTDFQASTWPDQFLIDDQLSDWNHYIMDL